MITCPECDGSKTTIASHVRYADGTGGYNVPLQCTRCGGNGEVPDVMSLWIITGEAMRKDRITRGMTLRREAERLGISAMELSRMEFGKIEPKTDTH